MEKVTIEELLKLSSTECLYHLKEFYHPETISLELRRNSKGQTLLHIAAGYGRTDLVTYLLSRNADVNAQDNGGQRPLHNACCHAHFMTSKTLIMAGADVNLTDNHGWSPLHFALGRKKNLERISPEYWKVVELLLESGADPYLKSFRRGRDCLAFIKNPEDRRAIKLLNLTHRLKNCEFSDDVSRETLVDKYLDVPDFFELVKMGDENIEVLEVVSTHRLLNSRLESCDNITPLHRAAGYNHIEAARLFISKGAQVDAADDFGRIPLHNAAQYGHIDMIELLISERSDINTQDLSGYSPLHVAASNRTFTACLKLIELGANVALKCNAGKIPYELAEADDVKEVLKVLEPSLHVTPSTSDQAIYIDIRNEFESSHRTHIYSSPTNDFLMLNSNSDERLFDNHNHRIKKIILDEKDSRYQCVKKRMLSTVMKHNSDSGGLFSSYEIISIELILNERVWSKYRLRCQGLEIDGSKNEKLLFHGSNFTDMIQSHGFDERYAQRNGMFGAGIYFAKHSSKSNQYAFGWGQGCQEHMDTSCYKCERKMIYAQVALGRSLISKEAMPSNAHAPPGYDSVVGSPGTTESLLYPEYVIYNGDQAYPLFLIRYRITN